MAMNDLPGSQPTFAIAGPTTNSGASNSQWRIVVLEIAKNADGVRVKPGWPVDLFGSVTHDVPHGVGIYSKDNSIYVVGGVHPTVSTVEEFTTVKLPAGGGTTPLWTDTWSDVSGKPSEGRAIAIDSFGNAFVTGTLLGQNGTEYATRMILRDPDISGNPVHGWATDPLWDYADGDDIATSISLSTELVSGVLRTYVYVTGTSQEGNTLPPQHKIATLRYRGTDGNQEWLDRTTACGGPGHKPFVIAAGQGNAYVVGRKYASSNYDYILQALTKAGADRFTAITYNGTASGFDEGRWGAMAGAGVVLYTGASAGTGTNADFLTGQHAETLSSTATPTTMTKVSGGTLTGALSDLSSVDGNYVTVAANVNDVVMEFESSVSITATELSFHMVGHVSVSGLRERVEVYDRISAAFVKLSDQPVGTSDAPTLLSLNSDAMRYIDPTTGAVQVRVTYYNASAPWTGYFNQVRWDTID